MSKLSVAQRAMLFAIKTTGDPYQGTFNAHTASKTLRSLQGFELITSDNKLTERGELAIELQALPPGRTTHPTAEQRQVMVMMAEGWAPTYGPAVIGQAIHMQLVRNGWIEKMPDGAARLTESGKATLANCR